MLGRSFSVVELDWARGARLWTFNGFLHSDPQHFVPDRETGVEIRMLDEADPVEGVALAPAKFAVHRAHQVGACISGRAGPCRRLRPDVQAVHLEGLDRLHRNLRLAVAPRSPRPARHLQVFSHSTMP